MGNTLTGGQVRLLFGIAKPSEVGDLIERLRLEERGWDWAAVGGREANATNVELSTEQTPPIIERITNGIDAMLELAQANTGKEPSTPREAAEHWFGVPGGTLEALEGRAVVNDLAPKIRVEVRESGSAKAPTVTIQDEGIGQHPSDLPMTILSLGASNKIGKDYLCGAYGHGGSSAFAWCPYTVLVSRRRPEHAAGKADLVGWTLVRKYDDLSLKLYTYQYLRVPDESAVPTFEPELLDGTGFEYGTYIAHVGYELGRYSAIWSLVGYRFLNTLLFDPVLPFAARDHREPSPQDRYILGTRTRLRDAPLEYRSEYVEDLEREGQLVVRYWVFKEVDASSDDTGEDSVKFTSYLEERRSNRTVAVTLNGQRHHYLTRSFIKNSCGYPMLSDSLLVQVDCDRLSKQRKKDLFPATRTGMKAGEQRLDLVEKCVSDALASDEELKRIEKQRVEQRLTHVDEKGEREVRRLLDRLIDVTRMDRGVGVGEGKGVGKGSRSFRAKDPPTLFRFVQERAALRLERGTLRVVDIRTDAPNNILYRRKRRARLHLSAEGLDGVSLRESGLRDGRMSVTVAAAKDAKTGEQGILRAQLEMEPDVYFATERPCILVPEPPPYAGQEPPSLLEIAGKRVLLRRGHRAGMGIRSDCRNDLLSRPDAPGILEVTCTIQGVRLAARRGPTEGRIHVFLDADSRVAAGEEGNVQASLRLADGRVLTDMKPCAVAEPASQGQGAGPARQQRPNYKVIPVWRELDGRTGMVWSDLHLQWNEGHVGKYDLSQDQLLLYVNMDHAELVKERHRLLTSAGQATADGIDLRYKAYIAHHLWLHFHRSRELNVVRSDAEAGTAGDETVEVEAEDEVLGEYDQARVDKIDDEEELNEEMRRVAKTILLGMRSQRDLMRQLAQGD